MGVCMRYLYKWQFWRIKDKQAVPQGQLYGDGSGSMQKSKQIYDIEDKITFKTISSEVSDSRR